MIPFDSNTLAQAKGIAPADMLSYALARGWDMPADQPHKGFCMLYAPTGDEYQFTIPRETDYDDYARAIVDAVSEIARFEDRAIADILTDIATVSYDTIRIEMNTPMHDGQTCSFETFCELGIGLRKLLHAAATRMTPSRKFDPEANATNANRFVSACCAGQTRQNPFSLVIHCPVSMPDDILASDSPLRETALLPFGRRTTMLIMRTLGELKTAVAKFSNNKNHLSKAVRMPALGAEFSKVLAKMLKAHKGVQVTFRMTWSSTLPKTPNSKVPSRVTFSYDHIPDIKKIGTTLLSLAGKESRRCIGLSHLIGIRRQGN